MARRMGASNRSKGESGEPMTPRERVKAIQEEMTDPNVCGQLRRTGTLCQRQAGWGTDHLGKGPCIYHEAKLGALAKNPAATHAGSQYTETVNAVEFYMELVNDPEIKKLDGEIALMRVHMNDIQDSIDEVRSRFADKKMPLNKEVSTIILKLNDQRIKIADTIGKLVDRKHKIEEGKLVTYRQVQETLAQVVYVIQKHIVDEVVLGRIADDLRRIDMSKFD
jgi:hypothetical protein